MDEVIKKILNNVELLPTVTLTREECYAIIMYHTKVSEQADKILKFMSYLKSDLNNFESKL